MVKKSKFILYPLFSKQIEAKLCRFIKILILIVEDLGIELNPKKSAVIHTSTKPTESLHFLDDTKPKDSTSPISLVSRFLCPLVYNALVRTDAVGA